MLRCVVKSGMFGVLVDRSYVESRDCEIGRVIVAQANTVYDRVVGRKRAHSVIHACMPERDEFHQSSSIS